MDVFSYGIAKIGKRIGLKALKEIACIVKPETIQAISLSALSIVGLKIVKSTHQYNCFSSDIPCFLSPKRLDYFKQSNTTVFTFRKKFHV